MAVVCEAADGPTALALAREHKPDVAVLDISMPGMDGLEVISKLQAELPDMPILVLTMHEEEQYVVRSLSAGAKGYITKRSAPEDLVVAIRKVREGGRHLSSEVAELLAERMARTGTGERPRMETLSNREIQVLKALAMGKTNREVAEAYSLSVKTVDTYRFRLLKKLNLRNNAELSRFAIRNGLIDV
jgi:DNA-binding NarL/FixJ family response regulator